MTDEQLKEIEQNAELQFTSEQIAIIMDDDEITAILAPDEDKKNARKIDHATVKKVHQAVLKGWLKSEADIRRSIKTQATQGVTQSHKLMLDLIAERKVLESENDERRSK